MLRRKGVWVRHDGAGSLFDRVDWVMNERRQEFQKEQEVRPNVKEAVEPMASIHSITRCLKD
jgi:hypothetical protein